MGLIDLAQFIPSLMSRKTSTPRQETFGRSISGACALASSLGPLTGLDFEAVDAASLPWRSRSEYVSHTYIYNYVYIYMSMMHMQIIHVCDCILYMYIIYT